MGLKETFIQVANDMNTIFSDFISSIVIERKSAPSYDPITGIVTSTSQSFTLSGFLLDISSEDISTNANVDLTKEDKKIIFTNLEFIFQLDDVILISGKRFVIVDAPLIITTESKIVTILFIRKAF